MIEREIKSLLSKEKYEIVKKQLFESYINYATFIQINYYYDTYNFSLCHMGNTLRIRQKDENLMIEYKYNKKIVDNVRICDEHSQEINQLPFFINSKEFDSFLGIDNCDYEYIGNLTTERIDFKNKKILISLDKNLYLGKIDYEIEIEFEENVDTNDILLDLDISINNNMNGKYNRFVELLKELR